MKAGDDEAVAKLWERYFQRLIALAKKRLGDFPVRVEDEEDIVVSAFKSLCEGAVAGRFDQLTDRDDLWRLLVVITSYKATDVKRRAGRYKRGGADGTIRRENVNWDLVADKGPSAQFLVELEDAFCTLQRNLNDDVTRSVAELRLKGHSNAEIADQLAISVTSVERKLRLIRQTWSRELPR